MSSVSWELREKTLFFSGTLNNKTVPNCMLYSQKLPKNSLENIDLGELESIDSSGVAYLDILQEQHDRCGLLHPKLNVKNTITTFSSAGLPPLPKQVKPNLFENIGNTLYNYKDSMISGLYLTADIFYWSVVGIFSKKGRRKGSVTQQNILIGLDSIGIIGLLSFILGLILALQSAAQLRQFGANIYVADLISISMVTEMGPILTAIILAGRTGSAIASEIATMKVTEEIDALKMMGLNPIRYIVVPKLHAMTLCISLLVTISTMVGILGGLIIALTYLDLSSISFFTRVIDVLTLKDVVVAFGKSMIFSWVIVIIGAYYGFNVKGGAEGVGKATTQSVVASIFWVLILDAINSMIFYFKI